MYIVTCSIAALIFVVRYFDVRGTRSRRNSSFDCGGMRKMDGEMVGK